MTQNNDLQVSITLGESSWRAIEDLLYHACQLRGRDWIRWQRRIAQTISGAIETARVPVEPCIQRDEEWDDWPEYEDYLHDVQREEDAALEHYR